MSFGVHVAELAYSWARANGFQHRRFGNNPQVVIVGEPFHPNEDQLSQQEGLIEILNPKVVLYHRSTSHEQAVHSYIQTPSGKMHHWLPVLTKDSCLQRLEDLARAYSFQLVGTELTLDEQHYIEVNCPEAIDIARRQKTGNKIVEYASRMIRPLIAIVKATDIATSDEYARIENDDILTNPKSIIHSILRMNGIGYICIDQTNGNHLIEDYFPGNYTSRGLPIVTDNVARIMGDQLSRGAFDAKHGILSMKYENPTLASAISELMVNFAEKIKAERLDPLAAMILTVVTAYEMLGRQSGANEIQESIERPTKRKKERRGIKHR
ncbi:hypothetical protein HYX01_03425 [Candidatus Woesearchaeota archaeon]|nr:hypothetical protein [Candidatus Woesearchaeota archaeon]